MIWIINTIVTKVLNSRGNEVEDDPTDIYERFSVLGGDRPSINTEKSNIPEIPLSRPSLIKSIVSKDSIDSGIIQTLFLTPN